MIHVELKNKKVGIFGLKKTGISAFNSLRGRVAELFCWDDNKTSRENFLNIASKNFLLDSAFWNNLDYIVVSPGVGMDNIIFRNSAKIISDIDLLKMKYPEKFYIAVTGTNGKSTTCALIYNIMKKAKLNFSLGGNIGTPVLELCESDGYVLELSSFQLDLSNSFNDVAVILNISEDHTDRYKSMNSYVKAKLQIFRNASYKIIGVDDEITQDIYRDIKDLESAIPVSCKRVLKNGFSVIEDEIIIKDCKRIKIPFNPSLQGDHNRQNIAAAYACSYAYNDKVTRANAQ